MCVATRWNEPKEQILRSSKVIVEKSNFNGALNNLWLFVLVDLKHKISSNMGQKRFYPNYSNVFTKSVSASATTNRFDTFKMYWHFERFNMESKSMISYSQKLFNNWHCLWIGISVSMDSLYGIIVLHHIHTQFLKFQQFFFGWGSCLWLKGVG